MTMRPDPDIVDKDGKPIGVEEFSRLLLDPEYKRVGLTEVAPDVWVVTSWLGINWSGGVFEPPQYFETMSFRGPLGQRSWLRMQRRYTTLAEAEAGHRAVCELINRIYEPGMTDAELDLACIADAGLVPSRE